MNKLYSTLLICPFRWTDIIFPRRKGNNAYRKTYSFRIKSWICKKIYCERVIIIAITRLSVSLPSNILITNVHCQQWWSTQCLQMTPNIHFNKTKKNIFFSNWRADIKIYTYIKMQKKRRKINSKIYLELSP